MALYFLDTNAVSDLLRDHPQMRGRVGGVVSPDHLVISTIVAGELLFGLRRMPQGARRHRLESKLNSILKSVVIEPLPESAAVYYAEIKIFRRNTGRNLDENDLWIAASTAALGGILVTRDADFVGTPGLIIEDWTRAAP